MFLDNDVVWVNRHGDKFKMKDIDDDYLHNILRSASRGVGTTHGLLSYKKLYNEALARGLNVDNVPNDIDDLYENIIMVGRGYEEWEAI